MVTTLQALDLHHPLFQENIFDQPELEHPSSPEREETKEPQKFLRPPLMPQRKSCSSLLRRKVKPIARPVGKSQIIEDARLPAKELREKAIEYEESANQGLALEYFTLAAKKGDELAQLRLGNVYWFRELGSHGDLQLSCQYYTAAAEQGCKEAEEALTMILAYSNPNETGRWDTIQRERLEQKLKG